MPIKVHNFCIRPKFSKWFHIWTVGKSVMNMIVKATVMHFHTRTIKFHANVHHGA